MKNYKYNFYMVDGNVLWRQKLNAEYRAEYFDYGEWYEGNLFDAKIEGRCYEVSADDAQKFIEKKLQKKEEQRARFNDELVY